jgi:hypothetical protein
MKTVFLLFLFLLPPFSLCAQDDRALGIAPGANLQALLKNGPDVISAKAETTADNWLLVEVDTHDVIDVPFENVKYIIAHIEDHPNVFNEGITQTKSVKVLNKKDNVTTGVFTYITKVGPVDDESYYTATVTVKVSDSKSYGEVHKQTDENITVRKLLANWYACAVVIDGKEYTYIRFLDFSEINQQHRKLFIKLGYRNTHANSLKQVEKAAKKL